MHRQRKLFTANKKRVERGNAFKVVNHRGKLGQLHSELVGSSLDDQSMAKIRVVIDWYRLSISID